MDNKESGPEYVNQIHLALGTDQGGVLVNMVVNIMVPQNMGNLFTI